ncbi:hypothetical protein PQQ52_00540 [Paraburkholderia sediminicola]|uniref:hypothetical protein n=1 Tax=Paraburkholderia sediminicola TaxID=458836 RepID=UPI0038BCA539
MFAWPVRFAYAAGRAHEDDADGTDLLDDLSNPNLADDLTAFMLGVPGHFPGRLFL